LANETGGFETIEKLGWAPGLNNLSGFPERESLWNGSRVTRVRRFSEHGSPMRRCLIAFSLEWLKWAMVVVTLLGVANGRAQTTPTTPPTKTWAPADESNDWFEGNWIPVGVPGPGDDVGIGAGGPAVINGGEAAAHTVTSE
jgi:hypothetical protein